MKILFVCTGNTCRSPLAEGYLNHKRFPEIRAISAGLMEGGEKVSINSALVAKEYGFNIDNHISRRLTPQIIDQAELIYCMDEQRANMLRGFCNNKNIKVLSGGIPDPYGMDINFYRQTLNKIIAAIDAEFPKIERASQVDAPAFAELESRCFPTPWSEKSITESMDNGTLFYKAVIGMKITGYIGIKTVIDEGYITDIAVLPEYRRRGIGRALLKKLEEDMSDIPLSFISLEVRTSNIPAQELYNNLGYTAVGKRKIFYSDPREDAIIMTKEL